MRLPAACKVQASVVRTLFIRRGVYRPSAAGMLPSSVQGCIYRVSVNTAPDKQRTVVL